MKILVTGAAGFIGFHTCLKLVEHGHDVYGIDNIRQLHKKAFKLNYIDFNNLFLLFCLGF